MSCFCSPKWHYLLTQQWNTLLSWECYQCVSFHNLCVFCINKSRSLCYLFQFIRHYIPLIHFVPFLLYSFPGLHDIKHRHSKFILMKHVGRLLTCIYFLYFSSTDLCFHTCFARYYIYSVGQGQRWWYSKTSSIHFYFKRPFTLQTWQIYSEWIRYDKQWDEEGRQQR